MEYLTEKMQNAGDSRKGCSIRDALAEIPFTEHLKALQDLKNAGGNPSKLDVRIAEGSTANNFDVSVYSSGASDKTMSELAKKLGIDEKELQTIAKNARGDRKPEPLFHERFQIDSETNKFVIDLNCHDR